MNGDTGNLDWLNSLAEAWWSWMAPVSVQVLVLLAVVYAIDRILGRKAWPRLLSALWLLVLLKLVLPPTLTSPLSLANVVDLSGAEVLTSQSADSAVAGLDASSASVSSFSATSVANASPSADPLLAQGWRASILTISFLIWLSGSVLLGLIAFGRNRRVRKTIAPAKQLRTPDWLQEQLAASAARLNMRTVPRLIVVDDAIGPAVFGVLRPLIVMPAALLHAASPAELEHVLLHELSHIKRRDPLWDFAALTLSVVYWFHPGVWLARRRLNTVRELCCDEAVAAALGDQAPAYRRTLLAISRPLWAPAGLAFFPRRSQLLERIEHLAQSPADSRSHRLTTIAVVGVVALCVIPLSAGESAAEPRETETSAAVSELIGTDEVTMPVVTKKMPVVTENTDKDLAARIAEQAIQPPGTTPVSYEMPPLDELQGCMQLRYAVYAEMAKQAKAANPKP